MDIEKGKILEKLWKEIEGKRVVKCKEERKYNEENEIE